LRILSARFQTFPILPVVHEKISIRQFRTELEGILLLEQWSEIGFLAG
jgi:hypothetical protein